MTDVLVPTTRVLMVCMGNICRSPTAEAVLRTQAALRGLARRVEVDSAGTHGWHAGEPPDPRAQAHGARRGYDLAPLRARRVQATDFGRFDLILAMDRDNLAHLLELRPPGAGARVELLMRFARRHAVDEVPDPYYGAADGFERVLDLVEDACEGLLDHLCATTLRP
ncbi:low molecular weight phosphotyrosine protein phosphatase [Calidifontimicrobium sp. SYSU G02091]|uniref:low molecular weight protein-tyrosine-phosphatase n=1 Tax=Calidifontimicrobium sp. SYSU G02091 TaxID=2926421 RepID=UPI001F53CA2A|nr:low molecular weight protein-tyrosine-phosphatase [Calidifontimicrobium sp. SYSU G02091]MCI1193772.1 low molecular weight phosphotyrosine protein phosphatase [Calidifontimicrobium sp. SYSU G02091]